MYYLKTLLLFLWMSSLISSCEVFGGGNKDEINGGEVVWSEKNQTNRLVSTQPLINDKRVYFIQDGYLKAYTLNGGEKKWSSFLKKRGLPDYSRKLIKDDGVLYIDLGGEIRAYSMNSGEIIWNVSSTSTPEERTGFGFPIMSQDESFLYAGRKGYVLKVRKSDGQITARYPLDRLVPHGVTQGATEPVISPFKDNVLYVPASYYDRTTPGEEEFGANMFAFEASTGNIIWETRVEYAIDDTRTEMTGDSVLVSPPIFDIELTQSSIVALQGKAIVVLNRFNGEMRWYKNFPDSGFDVGLAVEDGSIYAASVGNYAYRVDLQTGKVLWKRDITYANTSIPTVQNGRMYFNNSGGGGIWVLDTEDGSVIYNQPPPNHRNDSFDVYISSLGVGEGYMVDVGSKAVYCLKVP